MEEIPPQMAIAETAIDAISQQWIADAIVCHQIAIAGVVTDQVTNQPIVNAVVKLVEKNLSTQTAEDGSFYFIDLLIGQYTLNVSDPKLGSSYGISPPVPVNVQKGTNGGSNLTWMPVQLPPTQLSGKVNRSDNNQPIANAVVQLLGSEIQALTDTGGNYTLSAIQAGKPHVQASAHGFQLFKQQVNLTAGQATSVNFSLVPSSPSSSSA